MSAVEGMRAMLPPEDRAELDQIIGHGRTEGYEVDAAAVAAALLRARCAVVARSVPPLPPDLAEIAQREGGSLYEAMMDVDPTDVEAVMAARQFFEAECRVVAELVAGGLDIESAWKRLRDEIDRQPEPPRRKRPRRTRAAPRQRFERAAQPSTPTEGIDAPATAAAPSQDNPATVAKPAVQTGTAIPSLIVCGGRLRSNWIGGETAAWVER